jgi:hypothetical protein
VKLCVLLSCSASRSSTSFPAAADISYRVIGVLLRLILLSLFPTLGP